MSEYLSDNKYNNVRKKEVCDMKYLKMLFVVTSLTLMSSTLFAKAMYASGDYTSRTDVKVIKTIPANTKQDAYDAAFTSLSSLHNSSPSDLNRQFNIRNVNVKAKKTHLKEDSFITVQEQMNRNGNIEYVGLVNVKVHYIKRN